MQSLIGTHTRADATISLARNRFVEAAGGALFWLWVSGLLGMCTKYAEIVTALHYREPDETGTMRGGAMYTLRKGLGLPWLGTIFALLTSLAALAASRLVRVMTVGLDETSHTEIPAPSWITSTEPQKFGAGDSHWSGTNVWLATCCHSSVLDAVKTTTGTSGRCDGLPTV